LGDVILNKDNNSGIMVVKNIFIMKKKIKEKRKIKKKKKRDYP